MAEKNNITILVAPLDWGLGHASRCVPIIKFLLQTGCKVIIAAERAQENLLKNEFPALHFVHLQGYRIAYSRYKRIFPLKIVLQLPKILLAIKREQKWLRDFTRKTQIDAIISDNRYGLYHATIPAVFLTHQLLIKAPFAIAERILRRLNYRLIQRFSACWVPDFQGPVNIAGSLSHPAILPKLPVAYLGGLSRLQQRLPLPAKYRFLIIISGPEPQRTVLESIIISGLSNFEEQILLVRGLPGNYKTLSLPGNVRVENHLPAKELEQAYCSSEYIISRSGYTTVMDICKLQKKSILIPTPGQTEQEYLAKHLQQQRWCLSISQHEFSLLKVLKKAESFPYELPVLDMEAYQIVLSQFLTTLPVGKSFKT